MAIAQNTLVAAAGTAVDGTTFAMGSASPTASRLLLLVVTATHASSMPQFTFSGGPSVTWEKFIDDQSIGVSRRFCAYLALSGGSPGSGIITIGDGGATMTGIIAYLTEFSGVYLGASALESIYALNKNTVGSAATNQVGLPPGLFVTNDATVSLLQTNVNAALTCERTEIADAGVSPPAARLGAQWFLGNDSDGPQFSWTGSGFSVVHSFYLRDSGNPPPLWVPRAITTLV